ncbi:RND transporter [Georgfuchsia toluolica]|uniref:RND transporter n=1 Tax=Georgfuchsia toluolica TaxID=424218 RepID=A0A916J2J2_9PROT|nr:RND transporter [Georgfuchsia toluolica]CAG4883600.1 RND transporter [Georgfuchsia toluolica]
MIESGWVKKFAAFCIRRRIWIVSLLAIATAVLTYFAVNIEVKTVFADMLPSSHPYVKVHERFKDTFGGSNIVTIMVEVEDGDIFQPAVLEKVRTLTLGLRTVSAVNPFQIISLASKKLKEIKSSTDGIETKPLMWPDLPKDQQEIDALRDAVLRNPLVYGSYVSSDLKATLITVDFYDRQVDYKTVFGEINHLVDQVRDDKVKIRIVGDPILYGWVNYFLPETMHLVLATLLLVVALLFLFNRTWRNTLLPLIAGLVSAIWALGVTKLFGIHFEPLVIVVAVLISARAVSHSVQIVNRFDEEVEAIESGHESSETAACRALSDMFRPGMLGVIADAGCMAVVALSPIPLLQKLTVLSVVWVFTLSVSAVVLTPVLLSWGRHPKGFAHPLNVAPILHAFLGLCARIVTSRARYGVLAAAALIFVVSGLYAFKLKVGDANPGSPILWPDSAYNQDSAAINSKFQGVDRMFVVVSGENLGLLKKAEVMDNMNRFQRFMSAQPEIGATLSVADVVPAINRIIHEGNPRYQELGATETINGSLMFLFESVSEPGDLDRYVDNQYKNGAVTLFFRDRQGETIRTAVARIKEFVAKNPLAEGTYQLAGGVIGVMAAVNEIILSGQIEAIALALVVLVLLCTLTYRSSVSGMVFMIPVILSNTITFSVMAWMGIGMNINTVPVAALGIGLGVDYSFYIADRIKEELALGKDALTAITIALHSTGTGVLVTALVLIISVMLWSVSSLRFQAEMAMLMSIWLAVSTLSALLLMPSILYVFQPEFVFGKKDGAMDNGVDASAARALERLDLGVAK